MCSMSISEVKKVASTIWGDLVVPWRHMKTKNMSQNEPNWHLFFFDEDGKVLSHQNDGTIENISAFDQSQRRSKQSK